MNKNNVIEKHRGQGSYGYVNQVKDCNLGIVYAEKHLNLKKAKSKEKKRFINEYNIMHKYNHENLVKSYFNIVALSLGYRNIETEDISVFNKAFNKHSAGMTFYYFS